MLVMPSAVVHVLDESQDHAEGDRIETDERLVVDQQFRIHDDGARQRHAPRHAAGELGGHQIRRAAQADRLQLGEHQLADQGFGQIGVLAHRESDVLEHVHVGEQRAVLEQHAHALAQRVDLPRDRSVARSRPNTVTRGRGRRQSCPVISRSSVVLPVPLGPMMAVMRPRRAVRSRPAEDLRGRRWRSARRARRPRRRPVAPTLAVGRRDLSRERVRAPDAQAA